MLKNKILFLLFFCILNLDASERLKVFFDAGGGPGDAYSVVISNGAKKAAKDLNVDLKIYYSDWNPTKMVQNFKSYMAQNPAGIVIMGHPGDQMYLPLIKEAFKKGIKVSAVDTDLPKIREEFAPLGFGYAGSDNFSSGVLMAKECIKKFNLKAGDKVMVWGLLSQPQRGLRAKGINDTLKEAKIDVEYIEISPEINKDPSLGYSVFASFIAKNPDTKLAIIDHGSLTAQLTQFMKNLKANKDKLNIAGFTITPTTLNGLKEGYIDLISDAQPFIQGYLGVWQVVMSKKYAFSGFRVDTGGGFITRENVNIIEPLVKDGIR